MGLISHCEVNSMQWSSFEGPRDYCSIVVYARFRLQNFTYSTPKRLVSDRQLILWGMRICVRVFSSLSGGELFDQIADEDYKMTEAEVIRYVRQVCDGLQHMHEQNIVHLDVKVPTHDFVPEN